MLRSLVILVLVSLVSFLRLEAQTQYGIAKDEELIDAYDRLTFQYDTSQRPIKHLNMDGMAISSLVQGIETKTLSPKNQSDILLLKKELFDSDSSTVAKPRFFSKGNIFSYHNEMVSLRAKPLLHFAIGSDTQNDPTPFQNTRGIQIEGNIHNVVFFRTAILENQAKFLPHIEQRINRRDAIPGNGFYKRYQSGVIDDISGWDYLNAEGVLTWRPSEYFRASIGHGSHFIGSGYHSLLLSDYADNFFFLEFNTSIGILNYKNIFAELAPIGSTIRDMGDPLAPKKYMATHLISLAVSRKLELSLFESVIFGRENNFEFQYLNPLILYRVVEQKLDSPDNVMLGLDVGYKLNSSVKLYGQLLLDEFRFDQAFSGDGWWGNKVGYQLGLKWYDFLQVDHLDLLVEYNTVRPFTYSHRQGEGVDFVVASYSHYNQELAHPLGANFRELLINAKYRINSKWSMRSRLIFSKVGRSNSENVGQDIIRADQSRADDLGHSTLQGVVSDILLFDVSLTYHLGNGFYADAVFNYRDEKSALQEYDIGSTYWGLGFRANLSRRRLDY